MKWTRAVHHLRDLATKCAELESRSSSIYRLRVVQMWAVGEVLDAPGDLEWVTVALVVDLPADEVPWRCEPAGAEHWAHSTGMAKNPIVPLWRSVHTPVWNHHIERPALVWDSESGVAEKRLAALAEGRGDQARLPAPSAPDLRKRLNDELVVSLRALRGRTHDYEERRWKPGKLAPVADDLWRAADGYLDVLDALARMGAG